MSEYPGPGPQPILLLCTSPGRVSCTLPPLPPRPSCEKYKDVSRSEINDGGAPVPAPGYPGYSDTALTQGDQGR